VFNVTTVVTVIEWICCGITENEKLLHSWIVGINHPWTIIILLTSAFRLYRRWRKLTVDLWFEKVFTASDRPMYGGTGSSYCWN